MRGIRTHHFHILPHAEQQCVHGMATGREEAASAGILPRVPAVLAIPWADTVVIIHLPIVDSPKQTLVDDRFDGAKLAAEPAFKAHARFNPGSLDGFVNFLA